MSKAVEKSRRMRAAVSPQSTMVQMSLVAAMRAVSVLWLVQKPEEICRGVGGALGGLRVEC